MGFNLFYYSSINFNGNLGLSRVVDYCGSIKIGLYDWILKFVIFKSKSTIFTEYR